MGCPEHLLLGPQGNGSGRGGLRLKVKGGGGFVTTSRREAALRGDPGAPAYRQVALEQAGVSRAGSVSVWGLDRALGPSVFADLTTLRKELRDKGHPASCPLAWCIGARSP